jgi:hypothetical protein
VLSDIASGPLEVLPRPYPPLGLLREARTTGPSRGKLRGVLQSPARNSRVVLHKGAK